MKLLSGIFLLLFIHSSTFCQKVDTIVVERPRLTLSFVPPGPLGNVDISSYFYDTTVTFSGENFELTLTESGTVFSKRANINYESRTLAAACGEPRAYRQSDFAEWMTGVTASTGSNPLKVNGYNACLVVVEGLNEDREREFGFSLMVPFYTFTGKGPVDMKIPLMQSLRSFSFYGIDSLLSLPSDKPVPQNVIDALNELFWKPFDDMVETNVVMSKAPPNNVEDILNPMCSPEKINSPEPPLSLGLTQTFQTTIRRDGFVPISAGAEDLDMFSLACKGPEECGKTGGLWSEYVFSPVEISWQIVSGEGSFVQIGNLPQNQTSAKGENIILQPPQMSKAGEKKTVKIRLTAQDSGKGNPVDNIKTEEITVVFTGKTRPGSRDIDLDVSVSGAIFTPRNTPTSLPPSTGDCRLTAEVFSKEKLKPPVIQLPAIPDVSSLVAGERILLRAEPQSDEDKIRYSCHSSCGSSETKELTISEEIVYVWRLEGPGYFESGGIPVKEVRGSRVIYRAPESGIFPMNVKIFVKALNRDGLLKEENSEETSVSLRVFRPGIMLEKLPANWLPKFDTTQEVTSYLVVFNKNKPEEGYRKAFAHVSAVYNFQLDKVSNYTGICTNREINVPEGKKLDLFFDKNTHFTPYLPGDDDLLDNNRSKFLFTRIPAAMLKPVLSVKDFAAKGVLRVVDAPGMFAFVVGDSIQIPLDQNNNGIPDHLAGYETLATEQGIMHDSDDRLLVLHANAGDGYTLWEEYRGFMICSADSACASEQHIRTHPDKRDLFVLTTLNLTFRMFANASGITVHKLPSYGYLDPKTMGVNYLDETHKGGNQYAVLVEEGFALRLRSFSGEYDIGSVETSVLGQCRAKPQYAEGEGGRMKLYQVDKIVLNVNEIRNQGYNLEEVAAHELGHACNLPHHGDIDEGKMTHKCVIDSRTLGNNNCVNAVYPQAGSKYSGDMACIMRYDQPGLVTHPGYDIFECVKDCNSSQTRTLENTRLILDVPRGWLNPGSGWVLRNQFCRNDGSASPHGAVAAGRGNCYNKIKIKCW